MSSGVSPSCMAAEPGCMMGFAEIGGGCAYLSHISSCCSSKIGAISTGVRPRLAAAELELM